jgi:glycosyltransferase involved in cell wall biosynthesis
VNSNSLAVAIGCRSGDVESLSTWSGTPARLSGAITPLVKTCEVLNYQLSPSVDLAFQTACRLLRAHNTCRNPWINRICENTLKDRWKELQTPPDAFLHISDFCIPEGPPSEAKHFVYADAALPPVARYQSRPVRKRLIRDYCRLTRRYLDRTSLVFTMNEWTRRYYVEDHGFPADRTINVGFGINIAPFYGSKDFSRRLMLIVLRPNTEEHKGLNLLLAAWPMIHSALPDAELAVVGTQANVDLPHVTCYVNQPRETTVELMRKATLFTMPALCEPNGIVYPEALASRTPVLGLDRLAFPEFARGGECGFTVGAPDPELVASKVIEAFSDTDRLRQMGEDGQKFAVANYSWDRTARLIVDAMLGQFS